MQPTIEIKHTTDAANNVCFISIVGYICCVLYFYCWLHLLGALFLLLATSVVCFISQQMQPTIEIKHTTDAANNRNKAHNRCSQQ
jgi:mannitol-specific phosphotransferase system IIBC component